MEISSKFVAAGAGEQEEGWREQRKLFRWLLFSGIALMLAIAIGTAVAVDSFRRAAIDNGKQRLESAVLLLARHFDQQFGDFSVLQSEVILHLQSYGIASAEIFRGEAGTLALHEVLRTKVSGWTDVAGVNVFAADGVLINSSQAWPVPSVQISDREYFNELKENASTSLTIEVVKSRFSPSYAMVFARRISGPHGEFLGVVTRGISPDKLETFFASAGLGPNATISLYHRRGQLLARYPRTDTPLGGYLKEGFDQQRVMFEQPYLTDRLTSPTDGHDRLISARMLNSAPLVVTATTSVDSALTAWRSETKFFVGVATLSSLVVAAVIYVIFRLTTGQYRAAQRRLGIQKQRLDSAINNMSQGLLLFDSSERLIVCNRRYIEMYGLSADVVRPGASFREILRHRKQTGSFPGDVEKYCDVVLNNKGVMGGNIVDTSDGRQIWVSNMPVVDGGWLATHEDVTEHIRDQQKIAHLAHYDALTDLPNRVLFRQRIERKLAVGGASSRFAILYIDIDEFKGVNDSLGHHVGDELLKSIASRLQSCIGKSDLVARLGGDEFAIVQSDVRHRSDVEELVGRIYAAIRTPAECLGHRLCGDASIGIAIAPEDGSNLEQLLKSADLAMYEAKGLGRHTFRFFAPEMEARMKARHTLETDLRRAVADRAFEIHYQPLVDLAGKNVTGCEALLRWRHPERGMIPPAEFIPIAEEIGLIVELGEWVLRKACEDAMDWPGHVRLAVNVSPMQFKSKTLALKVAAALADTGLAPHRLEIEITEAVLIRDDDEALAVLHQLRDLGVRIALDDFGTGYSSLGYLQRFPFDKIKIDRSFINDIAEAGGSSTIVEAVINMATARNMATTAEGVETVQQCEVLRDLGCTQMQGYLFSPPVPTRKIAELLSDESKDSFVAA